MLKTLQLKKWNNKSKTHTKQLCSNLIMRNAQGHLLRIYNVTLTCTSTHSQQPLRLLSLIRLVEFENKYARQFGRWSNTNKHCSGVKNNITHIIRSQLCKSTKLTCCNERALLSCSYLRVCLLGWVFMLFFVCQIYFYKYVKLCNCLLKGTYGYTINVNKMLK